MTTISAKNIGTWDKAGRFYIKEEYQTESSNRIRTPSRRFPFSEYKHIFTLKYSKELAIKLGLDKVEIIK